MWWVYSAAIVAVNATIDMVILPAPFIANHQIRRALCDNFCHQAVAVLSWILFLSCTSSVHLCVTFPAREPRLWSLRREKVVLLSCFVAAGCGGMVDIDHFISAGSLHLTAATHLPSRPFGHAVSFVLLIATVLHLSLRSIAPWASSAYLVSSMSHLVRDASRRGLWLWPLGHTPAIPYTLHLLLIGLLPICLAKIVEFFHLTKKTAKTSEESGNEGTSLV